ncbi:hypothetical protein B0H14DRAFT_2585885 [Mycena olivaceomarginata]|nr:hypothetical protein B0H14DRAFT_2585885 [Mycena olivaceomarginata]
MRVKWTDLESEPDGLLGFKRISDLQLLSVGLQVYSAIPGFMTTCQREDLGKWAGSWLVLILNRVQLSIRTWKTRKIQKKKLASESVRAAGRPPAMQPPQWCAGSTGAIGKCQISQLKPSINGLEGRNKISKTMREEMLLCSFGGQSRWNLRRMREREESSRRLGTSSALPLSVKNLLKHAVRKPATNMSAGLLLTSVWMPQDLSETTMRRPAPEPVPSRAAQHKRRLLKHENEQRPEDIEGVKLTEHQILVERTRRDVFHALALQCAPFSFLYLAVILQSTYFCTSFRVLELTRVPPQSSSPASPPPAGCAFAVPLPNVALHAGPIRPSALPHRTRVANAHQSCSYPAPAPEAFAQRASRVLREGRYHLRAAAFLHLASYTSPSAHSTHAVAFPVSPYRYASTPTPTPTSTPAPYTYPADAAGDAADDGVRLIPTCARVRAREPRAGREAQTAGVVEGKRRSLVKGLLPFCLSSASTHGPEGVREGEYDEDAWVDEDDDEENGDGPSTSTSPAYYESEGEGGGAAAPVPRLYGSYKREATETPYTTRKERGSGSGGPALLATTSRPPTKRRLPSGVLRLSLVGACERVKGEVREEEIREGGSEGEGDERGSVGESMVASVGAGPSATRLHVGKGRCRRMGRSRGGLEEEDSNLDEGRMWEKERGNVP